MAFFQAGDAALVMLSDLKERGGGVPQRCNLPGMLADLLRLLRNLTCLFLAFPQEEFGRLR
jgi:hypothetical protein